MRTLDARGGGKHEKETASQAGARAQLNTALCLLCAAACVLTVVAADHLESKYDWQLDYSFNNITTQGEATENLLDSLTRDVRMYAVFSDGSEDSQLIALLNRYQARTPHITWSQENLTRNPLLLQLGLLLWR